MSEIEDLWKLQIDYGMLQKETDDLRAQLKTSERIRRINLDAYEGAVSMAERFKAERGRLRAALVRIDGRIPYRLVGDPIEVLSLIKSDCGDAISATEKEDRRGKEDCS
jgi:hypothetical protein